MKYPQKKLDDILKKYVGVYLLNKLADIEYEWCQRYCENDIETAGQIDYVDIDKEHQERVNECMGEIGGKLCM
jgi:hypothetical protein